MNRRRFFQGAAAAVAACFVPATWLKAKLVPRCGQEVLLAEPTDEELMVKGMVDFNRKSFEEHLRQVRERAFESLTNDMEDAIWGDKREEPFGIEYFLKEGIWTIAG